MDKVIHHLLNKGNARERMTGRMLARGGTHPSIRKALREIKQINKSLDNGVSLDSPSQIIKKALSAARSARSTINKDGAGGGAGMGAASPTGTGFSSGGAPLTGSQVYTPTAGGSRTRKEEKNVPITKPRDADPIGSGGGMG